MLVTWNLSSQSVKQVYKLGPWAPCVLEGGTLSVQRESDWTKIIVLQNNPSTLSVCFPDEKDEVDKHINLPKAKKN